MSTPSALLGWAVLVWGLPGWAAVWPDQLGGCAKGASKPAALADRALWDEYGLVQAEQAEYSGCANPFKVEAFRLKDSTGAMAAFEWQRPANSRPSKLAPLSVENRQRRIAGASQLPAPVHPMEAGGGRLAAISASRCGT